MSYSYDHICKAYHRIVAGQDIFVFTYETPARYLLNGYSNLIGIPYNDEDDAENPKGDKSGLSDVPPPSDDPAVANPYVFRPTHCRGSSATSTSIETYM